MANEKPSIFSPCKDCPDRHYLCHSECEKYLAFRKCRDEYLEQRVKESQLKDDLWATSRHNIKKKRRRSYADRRGGY